MNYGPLEFAAWLQRKQPKASESAAVQAARAAAPVNRPAGNRLTIITGPQTLVPMSQIPQPEPVSVYEAVAKSVTPAHAVPESVRVEVRARFRPLVLVLSSHQAVSWELTLVPDVQLCAVLLAGSGDSRVIGAKGVPVSSIGGFYAFKRGSEEFRHLEREVMRCVGRDIETFHSSYAAESFQIG